MSSTTGQERVIQIPIESHRNAGSIRPEGEERSTCSERWTDRRWGSDCAGIRRNTYNLLVESYASSENRVSKDDSIDLPYRHSIQHWQKEHHTQHKSDKRNYSPRDEFRESLSRRQDADESYYQER